MTLRNLGKTIQTQILYGLSFLPPPPPPSNVGMQLAVYSLPPLLFLFRNEIFRGMRECGNLLIERFKEKWQDAMIFGKYFKFRIRRQKPTLRLTDKIYNQYVEPAVISEVITPLENEYPKENKDGSFVV
jgi:hypothetical protein